jgi:hypothetical protein
MNGFWSPLSKEKKQLFVEKLLREHPAFEHKKLYDPSAMQDQWHHAVVEQLKAK